MTKLLSIDELAERLQLKKGTLYNQINSKRIGFPYVKLGRELRFREEDIEKFIDNRMVKPKRNL